MIIAHDLGTTGDKASLHDNSGRTLAAVTVGYDTDFGTGGVAEQDPDQWWSAVGEASRALLARTGTDPSDVRGVGLSGQMMGAVFLDADNAPLRPAMIWADHRSVPQAERLLAAVSQEEAYGELGHRIHPTYSLTKIMWVAEQQPDIWRLTERICLAKDFVALRMTGRLVTDPSDASSTNAWDQRNGLWSTRLLEAAGIDVGMLPEVVPATTVVGTLTNAAAHHTGLLAGTPVVIGGGDGPMAAVGAGVVAPEDPPYVSLGSSSWVSAATTAPLHDPAMRSMTFDHVVPGLFVPTATMQAGGASLSWVTELLGVGKDLEPLLEAAGEVQAADEGLFFLPHLLGERSPYWNAAAAGAFLGLERHHGPVHLVRAVLEGVGFNLRTCIEAFTDNGLKVETLDVIGGGAQSDTWMQVLADIWQIPVRQRTIVADANSLGAAVTAAVGLDLVDGFEVARDLSYITAEFVPAADGDKRITEQHQIFLDGYQRLEPWFDTRIGRS